MTIKIGKGTYIAESAKLIGDIVISDGVSIFDSAVLRADQNQIFVDTDSNIQDNVTVHVEFDSPTSIGKNVSIGHNAVVHGATIKDNVVIGMGAIVLSGAIIESGSVIGAGAVVTERFHVPPGSLVLGVPGKIVRTSEEYLTYTALNAEEYIKLREKYIAGKFERYKS